ncbi:3-methyladenine DNA glycosylase AlkD [Epibacterium ulvae]|uniref:3-methyladenine DNA glycosylase AlkD n=1 Tax=Epibacterium ulvae TaxID=1156985 RepID=A0A1G5QPJ4_9RHOB|nr:DNA alkylation repair protein [Epibacterium ulvae]SCZ63753.1 3-methyladenine DNA glycosylase AlkD [Epibacterium ulvae]
MTLDEALAQLTVHSDPATIEQKTAYHKQERPVLGVPNPVLNDLTKDWRQTLTLEQRISLAADLWQSDIFEARICAAKVLTQARIKEDAGVWELLCSWVQDFDSWAIADHACTALQKRLIAAPDRLDTIDGWTTSDHMWRRRAALVATLPWAKMANPKADDIHQRERILDWAATYTTDRNRFIQKAVGWWLRDLSKHDAPRVTAFLEQHGSTMKAFARKEAQRYLHKQG